MIILWKHPQYRDMILAYDNSPNSHFWDLGANQQTGGQMLCYGNSLRSKLKMHVKWFLNGKQFHVHWTYGMLKIWKVLSNSSDKYLEKFSGVGRI